MKTVTRIVEEQIHRWQILRAEHKAVKVISSALGLVECVFVG